VVLTNAKLILEDEVVTGTISFSSRGIECVGECRHRRSEAIDVDGDFIMPGIVDIHADNLDKYICPRRDVVWPNAKSALIAYDAQIAAAGITTVFDALSVGYVDGEKGVRSRYFGHLMDTINNGVKDRVLRVDHRIHIRCELSGPGVLDEILPHVDDPLVSLASLMDHTPGERQISIKEYQSRMIGIDRTSEEVERATRDRIESGVAARCKQVGPVVDLFTSRAIPLASHDDTTEDHVMAAVAAGVRLSEFPTTVTAANAAKAAGLTIVAGAPNIVLGRSHCGGVPALELLKRSGLDILCSDYFPSSMLEAACILHRRHDTSLPDAIAMVTTRPSQALGLTDRGRLKPGLRGDILRFRLLDGTPVIRGVWCEGRRVF
jgi:alpha-D-ribose 1-methylphosphonate 5-triphosphate diphosphatase